MYLTSLSITVIYCHIHVTKNILLQELNPCTELKLWETSRYLSSICYISPYKKWNLLFQCQELVTQLATREAYIDTVLLDWTKSTTSVYGVMTKEDSSAAKNNRHLAHMITAKKVSSFQRYDNNIKNIVFPKELSTRDLVKHSKKNALLHFIVSWKKKILPLQQITGLYSSQDYCQEG